MTAKCTQAQIMTHKVQIMNHKHWCMYKLGLVKLPLCLMGESIKTRNIKNSERCLLEYANCVFMQRKNHVHIVYRLMNYFCKLVTFFNDCVLFASHLIHLLNFWIPNMLLCYQRNRENDRQTDWQTDRQTDRWQTSTALIVFSHTLLFYRFFLDAFIPRRMLSTWLKPAQTSLH